MCLLITKPKKKFPAGSKHIVNIESTVLVGSLFQAEQLCRADKSDSEPGQPLFSCFPHSPRLLKCSNVQTVPQLPGLGTNQRLWIDLWGHRSLTQLCKVTGGCFYWIPYNLSYIFQSSETSSLVSGSKWDALTEGRVVSSARSPHAC